MLLLYGAAGWSSPAPAFAPVQLVRSVVDARVEKQYGEAHVDNAVSMPHDVLRERMAALDKDKPVVTYCNKGTTGNAAQNILINHGFRKVYNLSGGHKQYQACKKKQNKSRGE